MDITKLHSFSKVASILSISRPSVYYYIKEYNIPVVKIENNSYLHQDSLTMLTEILMKNKSKKKQKKI